MATISKAWSIGNIPTDWVSVRDFGDIATALASGAKVLYWPAGTYEISAALSPPNDQTWYGDGIGKTIIQFPQQDITSAYNMFTKASAWSNFLATDIEFKGSLDYQTSAISGILGFAFYVRDAINNVHFHRCKFTKFGDQLNYSGGGGGGAIAIGHPTTSPTTGKASSNISIVSCIFDTNSNVPGFYLSQGGTGGTSNVKLIGNHFTGGYSSGSAQNCVYILGADSTRMIEDVVISENTFRIGTSIDQCIELNWVRGFNISGNPMQVLSGVSTCSGHVLLRDGCYSGTISNNPMRDLSGNAVAGISLVRFASPGTGVQQDITINSNSIYGFDSGIQIDSGSSYITANSNSINTCGVGFKLAACSDVTVAANEIVNCDYAATYAGGTATMRRVKYEDNKTYSCNTGVIATVSASEDIQYAEFLNNTDVGSSGTNFIEWTTAAATGNRFDNNRSSLVPINPSHLTNFSYIKLADRGYIAFSAGDTTPNVRDATHFATANVGATTITDFDGGFDGQEIFVRLDTNTTIDFTGTNLKGNSGADLTGTATNAIRCVRRGTNWMCEVVGA